MKTAVTETSLAAFRALSAADLSRTHRLILDAMQPGVIYTRRKLESLTGLRSGPVCGRVFELIEARHIEVVGETVCDQSGKKVEALALSPVQRWAA